MMFETPEERAQRLDELRLETAVARRLRRAETAMLKRQPARVRLLSDQRDRCANSADMIEEPLAEVADGELPATTAARERAAAALRDLADALGNEIRFAWVEEP
ncbi:MAG: hypothetical protein ACRELC_04200 [Gemmatimonadota bacterium]